MTGFIDKLRGAHLPNNPSKIDALRVRAAGALIEVATALGILRAHLEAGGQISDPRATNLIRDARLSIREGGNLDHALDQDPSTFPRDSLVSRLLILTPSSHCQTAERMAAATKLAIIDEALFCLEKPARPMNARAALKAIDALSGRCWSLPARLPTPTKAPVAA